MRLVFLFFIVCCTVPSVGWSQTIPLQKVDSTINSKLEFLNRLKSDSLKRRLLPDSLSMEELDKLDSASQRLTSKIDSLKNLNLSPERYQRKLDSITNRLQSKLNYQKKLDSLTGKWEGKANKILSYQDSLQAKINARTAALDKKIRAKTSFLDSLSIENNSVSQELGINNTSIGSNLNVPSNQLQLPTNSSGSPLGIGLNPDLNLGTQSISENLTKKIDDIKDLSKDKIKDIGIAADLKNVKDKVGEVGETFDKVDEYSKEIAEIKEKGLMEAETIPEELGKAAANVSEIGVAQTELKKAEVAVNVLQQFQQLALAMHNKDSLKAKAKELSTELVDPFANEETKLKAGIAELDKLKKKYRVIEDSRYLPKRAPNLMKGKPLRERLVPGITLQFFKADAVAFDLAPYLAYKLSGRFRPGIGFNYRVETSSDKPYLIYGGVYGFRLFNDIKLQGTFWFHVEYDRQYYTPDALIKYRYPAEELNDTWSRRLNLGLFKTYRISKRFDGQAQLLYNVLEIKNFPQSRGASLRFGFEYKMGKHLKKKVPQLVK